MKITKSWWPGTGCICLNCDPCPSRLLYVSLTKKSLVLSWPVHSLITQKLSHFIILLKHLHSLHITKISHCMLSSELNRPSSKYISLPNLKGTLIFNWVLGKAITFQLFLNSDLKEVCVRQIRQWNGNWLKGASYLSIIFHKSAKTLSSPPSWQ